MKAGSAASSSEPTPLSRESIAGGWGLDASRCQRRTILFDPVELRLPPLEVSPAAFPPEPLDVHRNRRTDRRHDPRAGRDTVGIAEDPDPVCLLGRIRAIGADVQPEKERIA